MAVKMYVCSQHHPVLVSVVLNYASAIPTSLNICRMFFLYLFILHVHPCPSFWEQGGIAGSKEQLLPCKFSNTPIKMQQTKPLDAYGQWNQVVQCSYEEVCHTNVYNVTYQCLNSQFKHLTTRRKEYTSSCMHAHMQETSEVMYQ